MAGAHVLFLTQHYPPEAAPTGQLLAELAEDLIARGFRVTVLAGRTSYGVVDANGRTDHHERSGNLEVIRTFSTRFSRTSSLGRVINWLSYPLSSLVRGTIGIGRPDLVVAYTAPPTAPMAGFLLALRWRAKFVLYVQDVYPDIAVAVGALRSGILTRIWGFLNRFAYRRSNAVLALGDCMAARLRSKGVPNNKIAVVHNWADGERLNPMVNQENILKEAWGLNDRFVVLYSGNLGMAHDFGPVCGALGRLMPYQDRLAFLFVGEGVRRRQLEEFVQQERLEGLVQFRDYVPQDQLPLSLGLGDAGLVTTLEGTEGLVVPSKLYSYLAMGKPVLAVSGRSNEVSDIVQEARCGFVIRTAEELVRAVETLMTDPSMCEEMGQRARTVFEERFERRCATARLGDIFERVVVEGVPCPNGR